MGEIIEFPLNKTRRSRERTRADPPDLCPVTMWRPWRDLLEKWLDQGKVYIEVVRGPGVLGLPDRVLKGEPFVGLNLSHDFGGSLSMDEEWIEAELSFDNQPAQVCIHYSALFLISNGKEVFNVGHFRHTPRPTDLEPPPAS